MGWFNKNKSSTSTDPVEPAVPVEKSDAVSGIKSGTEAYMSLYPEGSTDGGM